MNTSEVGKVYAALMSSPGMLDVVKVDLKMNRRMVLLLVQVLERGILPSEGNGSFSLVEVATKEELEQLKTLTKDCLQRAGMVELHQQLKAFHAK